MAETLFRSKFYQPFTMELEDYTQSIQDPPRGQKTKLEQTSTCLPVSVRAVERAIAESVDTGGHVYFYGADPGVLILVGLVEAPIRRSSCIEFCMNDGTGRMMVKLFSQHGCHSDSLQGLDPGHYVTVYGQVHTLPIAYFGAIHFHKVESADEISYHMIECAYAKLRLNKDNPKPDVLMVKPHRPSNDRSMPMTGERLQQAILAVLREAARELVEGLAFDAICKRVSKVGKEAVSLAGCPGISIDASSVSDMSGHKSLWQEEVRQVLAQLVELGEVYTTIDDDHFAII